MQYEPAYYIGKYRTYILAVCLGVIILAVGLTIYTQWRNASERAGKIAVPVEIVPRDAQVKLDKKTITSRGTAWIAPGEYTATIERDGFTTQTRTIRVSENAVPYIYIALAGQTDEAKKWQASHQSDYQRLELLTIQKSREYNTRFKSNNPIVNILPIKDPYYTIDYRNHDDTTVELIIYGTSPRYRKSAIEFLRSKGYDPTDYRVSYEGFTNPLTGESHE